MAAPLASDRGFTPPLAALRGLRQARPPAERCELCAADLRPSHTHLLRLETRELLCACDACGVLFSGQAGGAYRRVTRRIVRLADFALGAELWAGLNVPIGLAFFVVSSGPPPHVTALYPSPAGATEAGPTPAAWDEVVAANPALRDLATDTEALLVNHLGSQREHYYVSLDVCYELVGLVRTHWHGLSGGTELWAAVARFFEDLRRAADGARNRDA
jgi:hypothetical protein